VGWVVSVDQWGLLMRDGASASRRSRFLEKYFPAPFHFPIPVYGFHPCVPFLPSRCLFPFLSAIPFVAFLVAAPHAVPLCTACVSVLLFPSSFPFRCSLPLLRSSFVFPFSVGLFRSSGPFLCSVSLLHSSVPFRSKYGFRFPIETLWGAETSSTRV